MKLKIRGSVGKQEIIESISRLINSLEDAGVNEFYGLNLYFNARSSGQKVVPLFNGEQGDIVIEPKGLHVNQNEDGQINYVTGLGGAEINLSSRLSDKLKVSIQTEAAIKAEEASRIREEKERIKRTQEELMRQRKAKHMAEVRDQQIASLCEAFMMKESGLSAEGYAHIKSSTGWIKSRRAIERYTAEDVGDRVFRISLKVPESNQKDVFLFNEDAQLVFKGRI